MVKWVVTKALSKLQRRRWLWRGSSLFLVTTKPLSLSFRKFTKLSIIMQKNMNRAGELVRQGVATQPRPQVARRRDLEWLVMTAWVVHLLATQETSSFTKSGMPSRRISIKSLISSYKCSNNQIAVLLNKLMKKIIKLIFQFKRRKDRES